MNERKSIATCPICQGPLRCEPRGESMFAWCDGRGLDELTERGTPEPSRMGCSGIAAFGCDTGAACVEACKWFVEL